MLINLNHTELHQSFNAAPVHVISQNTNTIHNNFPARQSMDPYVQRPMSAAELAENQEIINTFAADSAYALSIDKFIHKLDSIKSRVSSQRCARSIRLALESAGAVIGSHPVAASDWGNTLMKIGYKQIQPEFDRPQEGDIYIIHRTNKHVYGHIAGFTGSEWVSDFKQKSYDVYNDDSVQYEYYRLGM